MADIKGQNIQIKQVNYTPIPAGKTNDGRPSSWCPYCFRTHAVEDQNDCHNQATEVYEGDTYWLPEEIVGYRGFKIQTKYDGEGPFLKGARAPWYYAYPGPAECIGNSDRIGVRGEHKSPHPLCTCGYHALRTRNQISTIFPVHAKVLLWGDVIEHEDGWRAEHAKIVALDYTYKGAFMFQRRERVHHTLQTLRKKYEVEEGEM